MTSRPDQTPERLLDERLADTAGLVPTAEDIFAAVARGQVAVDGRPHGDRQAALDDGPRYGVPPDLQAGVPFGPVDEVYERMLNLVFQGLAPRT